MLHVSTDINRLIREPVNDPDFPHAPLDWTRSEAMSIARRGRNRTFGRPLGSHSRPAELFRPP